MSMTDTAAIWQLRLGDAEARIRKLEVELASAREIIRAHVAAGYAAGKRIEELEARLFLVENETAATKTTTTDTETRTK